MDRLEKLRPAGEYYQLICSVARLTHPGRLEQYSTARHHLNFYFNVAAAATYTLPASYILPVKDYIYKACESLIYQHPSLSAIPVDEGTKHPYFVRLPGVDLDQPISFRERLYEISEVEPEGDRDLDVLLRYQHNKGFTRPAPFWRLCILTDSSNERCFTAVFVYHHAIGDGSSGKSFHRTFLQALHAAASLAPGEAKRIILSPRVPLLPSLEEVHALPVSLPFLLGAAFRAKIWSPKDPGLWTGGAIQTPLDTQVCHFALPKAVTTFLKNLCRAKETTITGLVQTLFARSMFHRLPINYTSLKCSCAISTRRWLPDPITDDSIGVWVEDYQECYKREAISTPKFPWPEAQRTRKAIEAALALKGKDSSPNLLKYVKDYHYELFLSQIGKKRLVSYEMSNVGIVGVEKPGDSSKPTLGRMVFSQSANVVGGAVMISVVTGGDGCLTVALTWQTNVVEYALMKSVVGHMKRELHGLAGR